MDSFFLSQQYEYVQRITEEMLAASEQSQWERVFELEQKRTQLLADMSNPAVQATLKTIEPAFAKTIRQCIHTVLEANILLSARAETQKNTTQTELRSSQISSRLNRTYSSPY